LYGLIRTAPIGEDALRLVPAEAAAVAAIGLNPPAGRGNENGSDGASPLALMDIGRELFSNVRSISAFVMPSKTELPEVGVIVYAQDGSKSKDLWTRLMSLPAQFGAVPASAVKEVKIRGRAATQYAYPEAPPIFVVQPNDGALVVGTAVAVEASLAALDDGTSLATQAKGAGFMDGATGATSKAVFLRGGQLLKCARPSMGEHERRELAAVEPLLDKLNGSFTVDEEENELRLQVQVSGVPRVGDVLRAVGGRRAEAAQTAQLEPAATP
jgi:hypothetical protein